MCLILGRAWLYLALSDRLLESYIHCFINNAELLRKHYVREALVLDEQVGAPRRKVLVMKLLFRNVVSWAHKLICCLLIISPSWHYFWLCSNTRIISVFTVLWLVYILLFVWILYLNPVSSFVRVLVLSSQPLNWVKLYNK